VKFTLRVATFAGLALLGRVPAEASMDVTLPGPMGGRGTERGVVEIRCSTGVANLAHVTRGVVLNLAGDAKRDVVFTTAHGLPDSREAVLDLCRVFGAHGQAYKTASVWRSSRETSGLTDDWALVLVERRLDGEVGRLTPAKVTGDELSRLADRQATVRLLLRQADPREGDCRLRNLTVPFEYGPTELLIYSCGISIMAGAPGLSGSPLLIGVEGRSFVIGVHLGWGLQTLDDGRLHAVSLGRPIDGEIAAAIAAAAEEARR
jgi:hypothetical protein